MATSTGFPRRGKPRTAHSLRDLGERACKSCGRPYRFGHFSDHCRSNLHKAGRRR